MPRNRYGYLKSICLVRERSQPVLEPARAPDGIVIAVTSRGEARLELPLARPLYRLRAERAIMQLVIAFVNTRQSMAHSPPAFRYRHPRLEPRLKRS